ncbi:MAG TPA: hypothetical protein VMV43_00925 [Candidatus Nanopelagicaceae bacterium]|nr:hypothetical protein [Candidatus Nanopelagicaceae bacterium]
MSTVTNTTYEELVASVIKTSRETIESGVQRQLQEHLINQLSYSVKDELSKIAADFIEKELKEDILAEMRRAKEPILSGIREGVIQVGAKLAETLFAKAVENLTGNSYRSEEIVKKLFD